MIKKKNKKTECFMCKKEFTTKIWVSPSGCLKGHTIIETVYCSKKCKEAFKDIINKTDLNQILITKD